MAAHFDSATLKSLPIKQYASIRPTLKSGDLFFASGDYAISKTIQMVTKSPWSHVGVILRWTEFNRVLLLESVEDMGVRIAPVSKYLTDYGNGKPYKGRIAFARFADMKPAILDGVTQFGLDELTRPYDQGEIVKIATRVALGLGKKVRDREYICSELVYECFAAGGKDIPYNKKGFISPEDVWADPTLKLLDRVQ